MKQIKKIIIENFQCHDETILEPAPTGLTVITGPSDHGKSAVVRAIKWLMYNRPLGNDFVRHGQSECTVTLELDDAVVVRRRTASFNQYYVNDQLYEGFGNNVPLEVQKALGIYNYDVGDETLRLNVAGQLEGPFLGSGISSPARAKILGKIAGAETIDKANQTLGTDLYHAKRDKDKYTENLKEKDKEIEKYKWVVPLEEKIKLANTKMALIELNHLNFIKLKELKSKLYSNDQKKAYILQLIMMKLSWVDAAKMIIDKISLSTEKKVRLISLNEKLKRFSQIKFSCEEKLAKLKEVKESINNIIKIQELSVILNNLNLLKGKFKKITSYKNTVNYRLYYLKEVKKTKDLLFDVSKNVPVYQRVNTLFNDNKLINIKKEVLNENLNRLVGLTVQIEKISYLLKEKESFVKFNQIKSKLNNIEIEKKTKQSLIKQWNTEVGQLKKNYVDALLALGICSRCGSKINENNLKEVI